MLNIVYDATQLVDGEGDNSARRGIYFVALNVLRELLKREDVNVCLWASPNKIFLLNKWRKKYFPNALSFYERHRIVCFFSEIMTKIRFYARKQEKHFFLRKILWGLVYLGEYLVRNLFALRLLFSAQSEKVFLSPKDAVPRWFPKKNIYRFVVLYDTIPFILADYNSETEKGWFKKLVRNINPSDYYFAISETTKKDFCHFFPKLNSERIQVTYLAAEKKFRPVQDANLLNRIKEKYKIPLGKKYIFSLCVLESRKNLIRAVRTFIDFLTKNQINDLVWVLGGGAHERFAEQIKREMQHSESFDKCVLFAGYIDDDDLPILYSNAEWFVFTTQYEGFGLPPLEAMQCGCPVITSNNSSLPEVVGDAGIMIDWDDDEQHIEAYEKYYFNEKLRKENSQKGLERAKMFSWAKTVDGMVEFMQSKC